MSESLIKLKARNYLPQNILHDKDGFWVSKADYDAAIAIIRSHDAERQVNDAGKRVLRAAGITGDREAWEPRLESGERCQVCGAGENDQKRVQEMLRGGAAIRKDVELSKEARQNDEAASPERSDWTIIEENGRKFVKVELDAMVAYREKMESRSGMRLLNQVLDAATKYDIADHICTESRSKSDVVQDVWDELVKRGLVREPVHCQRERGLPMSEVQVGMRLRHTVDTILPVITVTGHTENGFTYRHERFYWRPGEWSEGGECYGQGGYSYYKPEIEAE